MLVATTTNSLPLTSKLCPPPKESLILSTVLRVFLIQTASGLFSTSGGHRANYYLLSSLASKGHTCRSFVLCSKNDLLSAHVDNYTEEQYCFGNEKNKVRIYRFVWNGVEIVAPEHDDYIKVFPPGSSFSRPFDDLEKRKKRWMENKELFPEYDAYVNFITNELVSLHATHFIFNDSVALKIASTLPSSICRIFICHACEHLSFGPYAGVPGFCSTSSPFEYKWLKEIEGVWAVSRAVKEYIGTYGEEVRATHLPLHPAIFGEVPFKKYCNFEAPYVVSINPGSYKGYSIFKKLAERNKDIRFAAVKSWNVSDYQLKELKKIKNVKVLMPFKDMEKLWSQVKVLLVPSLWYEAFGLVVVEAMLHGIPVICSDVGGLPEAKCGVSFGTISVNIITGERETDELNIKNLGIYKIPPQNIEPWEQALRYLINERDNYERISQECYDKANSFVQGINPNIYEKWLIELKQDQKLLLGYKLRSVDFHSKKDSIETKETNAINRRTASVIR
ncbi:Glycosyltransferase Family 4 protein [Glomus cerebriforme]|uniref:Glycosyltransferase Family 4 protein n=1 Tax=Glomus cerebriforme TaxID=658196 RepID=A0A397TIN0_9GLOM|nr:Glycosyltransferase Family 4 protein [Glomus cerebriforme]